MDKKNNREVLLLLLVLKQTCELIKDSSLWYSNSYLQFLIHIITGSGFLH